MENFDDIRPYLDSEVPDVIKRLLKNKEFSITLTKFQLPRIYSFSPWLAHFLVKRSLNKKLGDIKSIEDVQNKISFYVDSVLAKSTTGLTHDGLGVSEQTTAHLFISNHRDIVMDPSMVGYLLHDSVYGTTQIAIGDNLLKKEYISDLMRLNKSFIVKRSVQGREKLTASIQLSQYINHMVAQGNNVWIAQREGRSKDGLDKTDPTILKMLHMSNRDPELNMTLKDTINSLHIIPVSISYEYDPCAELKARELYEIDTHGKFVKDENSDIISISSGLTGHKGAIHVSFGEEIIAVDDDPIAIAQQIDKQIILNYKLHPSNYLAYEMLQSKDPSIGPSLKELGVDMNQIESKRKEFNDEYERIDNKLKHYFINMYANSVINKFQFKEGDID